MSVRGERAPRTFVQRHRNTSEFHEHQVMVETWPRPYSGRTSQSEPEFRFAQGLIQFVRNQ